MQMLREIRRLEGLRSLVGSTSTPMAGSPKSSSDAGEKLVGEHSLEKAYMELAHIKLIRAKEEVKLLEIKLQLVVYGQSKVKLNQNEDSKLGQGFNLSSVKTMCDQLAKTLLQLVNKTEEAEEDNKVLKEMLGKNSIVLDEFNCLLHDLSAKLESEEQNIISEKLVKGKASFMNNLQVLRREPMSLVQGKLEQAVNEKRKVKDKHTKILELCHRLDSKMSLLKTLCNQLIEKKRELDSQTVRDPTTKKPQAEMGNQCNENISRNSSECYLINLKKDHSTKVARIQQYNKHKKSTQWAYNKEELQHIQRDKHKLRNVPFAKRSFHSTTCRTISNKKKMARASPINDSAPGNTATIILDPHDIQATKRSYRKGIRKVRAWCRANSEVHDVSDIFGPGAELYTTPVKGTFHLSFQYNGRRLTFFIYGTNLYLMGWESDKLGMFELTDDASKRFIKNLACAVLKMGVNYNDLVAGGVIKDVRLGPFPLMEKFDVLHKCNSASDEAMKAILVFAVNISEAIRIKCIFKRILKSFDMYDKECQVITLGEDLALKAKRYGHYSRQLLKHVDFIIQSKTAPEIVNRGFNFQSVQELRIFKVPLRTAYNEGIFKHDPEPPVWSPPYADGKDWVDREEEEEEEEELKEENEHEQDLEEEHDHEKDLHEEEEEDVSEQKLCSNGDRFPLLKMTGNISRFAQTAMSGRMSCSLSRELNEEEEENVTEQKLCSNGDDLPVLKMTSSISWFAQTAMSGRMSCSLSRELNEEEEENATKPKLCSNDDHFPVLKMTGSISGLLKLQCQDGL